MKKISKTQRPSKVKNLDLPIYAPLLNQTVNSRWLIIKKRLERWTSQELSDHTGIPKSTIGTRTLGFNGSYNLLNSFFSNYILNTKIPDRRRKEILLWVTNNLELLGDYGTLQDTTTKDCFLSRGQEKYFSRKETKDNLEGLVDYLQIVRGWESTSPKKPLNLKLFLFFTETLCRILSLLTTITKTPSTSITS